MSIQHALLVSLLERPSTGYELANRFDRSIGYFWQATHQQIYRELARMAKKGWLRAEDAPEGGKRRRKIYHVLPAGRSALIEWVKTPELSLESTRGLLIKLRAEATLGPLGVEDELRELIEQHEARLHVYRNIERRDFSGRPLTRAQRLQYAVLRSGIVREESWLHWAREVLPLLATD
ncbi:PadR family transcriptional regulator [Alkalilimnicola ehrlichii]|uniref:PadR family transcriptional regulator n=1 Tax=Alkalilimnicola ehrlichii TaxID=351052 RepID=A0A3E0WRT7_9GAMM|nr:PadR family transcriptional regulator [Alkalilimnicola ehrlichii]RFA28520.1 PadR family transcriptional regulator [Alkalilimnicola ehrlichii]RFA35682.1 PadR family transcriptional regulator [Alkalilimnicola ehrlichii]